MMNIEKKENQKPDPYQLFLFLNTHSFWPPKFIIIENIEAIMKGKNPSKTFKKKSWVDELTIKDTE